MQDTGIKKLNIAVLGGGEKLKNLLELISKSSFQYLEINILKVCDLNHTGDGFMLARDMGISVTDSMDELLKTEKIDTILELTGDDNLLIELIRKRNIGIGIIEHNSFDKLSSLLSLDDRLKSAEDQVLLERMVSDFLIQESSQRILVLNTDFTIAEVNDEYLSKIGKNKNEVSGSYCYKTIQGYNVPCSMAQAGFTCPMIETLRTGKSAHVILEDPDSVDVTKYIDVVTYPVKDKDGEITKVIEVWRDITDQLSPKLEKRVKVITEDMQKIIQEDRMISLGKLSASCVHEINNPIQGLITYSCLMKDILDNGAEEKDLENFKKYLSIMTGELERCGSVISGLLSFSRENIKEFRDVDINEIINSVISLVRHKMKLQNIEILTEPSGGLLFIKGDTNSLQQCFLNIFFNAAEAMENGGTLKIVSKSENRKAVIEISDSGAGIEKEAIDHIFEPFYTTKSQGEGTGLGLSIVYGIVKNHTGKIKVENKDGAKFFIEFPLVN